MAINLKMKDPSTLTQFLVGVLIGVIMYPQLKDSADELEKVSFYNESSCTAVKVDDPNNPPDGVVPLSPIQGILYSLIPLGFAWFLLDLIMNADKNAGIKNIATISLTYTIGGIVSLSIIKAFTPQFAEVVCQAKKGNGIADTILSLIGLVYPLLPIGVFGGVEAITRLGNQFKE